MSQRSQQLHQDEPDTIPPTTPQDPSQVLASSTQQTNIPPQSQPLVTTQTGVSHAPIQQTASPDQNLQFIAERIGGTAPSQQQGGVSGRTLTELLQTLAPRSIKFDRNLINQHGDDRQELLADARRLGSRSKRGDEYFNKLVDLMLMVKHHPDNPSPREAVQSMVDEEEMGSHESGLAQAHLERYFQPKQAWTSGMQEYFEKHPMSSMDDFNKANAIVRQNMTFKSQNIGPSNVYQDQVSENMFKLAGVVGPHAQLPVSNYLEHEKRIFHDPKYVGPSDRFQMERKALFTSARVNDHPLREKTVVYNDFDERHSQRHQMMKEPKREFQLRLGEHSKPFKMSKVPKPINPHKTEKQIKKSQTGSDFSKEDVPKNKRRRSNTQKLTKLGPQGHTLRHKKIRHPRPRARYYDEL